MIIASHHRSAALAARHLRELRRKYHHAELLSRRDSSGRFNVRGKTFIFEVREKPKKVEYVLHFDYGKSNSRNLVRFQLHVIAPADATDREVIEAIRERNAGKPWRKGFKLRSIYWSKPNVPQRSEPQTDPLSQSLRKAGIENGEATISGKNPVGRNRRPRNKRKR